MISAAYRVPCLALCLLLAQIAAPRLALGQGGPASEEVSGLLDKGKQALAAHDFEGAIRKYTEALTEARVLSDKAGEAEALRQTGVVYSNAGQPSKAIEVTEQSLAVSREAKDRPREASALNNLGRFYSNIGQMDRALSNLSEALRLRQSLKNPGDEELTLFNIGYTYYLLGQPDQALARLAQALKLSRETGNRPDEAACLHALANVYLDTGEPLKALDMFRQVLALVRQFKDGRGEAAGLGSIGNVYKTMGEPLRALAFYQQSLPLYREAKDRLGEAAVLGSMGRAYEELRQPRSALALYEQALPLFKAIGDRRGESGTLSNIGVANDTLGQRPQALEFYRQALEICRQTRDPYGEAGALNGIGHVFLNTGHTKQARECFLKALALHRQMKDKPGEARDLGSIALTYLDDGRPDLALAAQRQALLLHREAGDKTGEATTLGYIAQTEKMLGRLDDAERHARAALISLEASRAELGGMSGPKIGFMQSNIGVYYRAIDVLLAQKKTADAFAITQRTKARALLDLLDAGKVNVTPRMTAEEKQKEQELRRQTELLNTRMVAEGVRNEVGAKKRFAALKVELARAEDALQAFTVGLYARYPELARKRVARTVTLADVARFLPQDTALLEYVVLQGESKVEKRDRTVLFVVTRHAAAASVRAYSIPVGHAALAQRVDAFRAACADPRKPYAKEAAALYRLLVAPAATKLAGKKRLLICPDGPLWNLPFAALTSSRAQRASHPHADSRRGSEGRGEFLAERFEIDYAYSATGAQAALLAKTDKRRARPTRTLLALANPDFGDEKRFGDTPGLPGQRPIDAPSRPIDAPSRPIDAPSRPIDAPSRPIDAPSRPIDAPSRPIVAPSRPIDAPSRPIDAPSRDLALLTRDAVLPRGKRIVPLPGTQREADMLARLFPGAAIYTGKQAQEQVFKEKAAGCRYIHLASHAFFNDAAPLLSSVVLADPPPGSPEDGFLTAREIFDLDLSASDLVVLSACNTARGENLTGEGVIGLTWALFVAGAPTQVVSQWSVDDASTATLMEAFYTRLKRGEAKGASLRDASLSLLRGENPKSGYPRVIRNPKYVHPYYWAPFVLIGDWRR